MIDVNELHEILKAEYSRGQTIDELAEKYGVSHTYMHRILSSADKIEGITIRTLNRMFPHCCLELRGNVSIEERNVRSNRAEVNNGTMIAGNVREDMHELEEKVLDSEELTAEEKVKMLRLLRSK